MTIKTSISFSEQEEKTLKEFLFLMDCISNTIKDETIKNRAEAIYADTQEFLWDYEGE